MNSLAPTLPRPAGWRLAGLLLGAALALTPGLASALEITLPPETVFFQPSTLPGYALASAACVTCHSADYIRTQPPTAAATWKAEVLKMRKVYGAPITDDQVDPIAAYLFQTYSPALAGAAPAPAAASAPAPHG